MRPRLLDLFCGAGGAAVGYHRAGFQIVGIDNRPQPNYPFTFIEGDALHYLEGWMRCGPRRRPFAAIHASPPCQAYVSGLNAVNRQLGRELQHVDLVACTRDLLLKTSLPYVIENVPGAPLRTPVRLCGSSFGLQVRRHRLFETTFPLLVPPCFHGLERGDYWTSARPKGDLTTRSRVAQVYGDGGEKHRWGAAMGIDWMTPDELAQAFPPAYTELIGHQLLRHLDPPSNPGSSQGERAKETERSAL